MNEFDDINITLGNSDETKPENKPNETVEKEAVPPQINDTTTNKKDETKENPNFNANSQIPNYCFNNIPPKKPFWNGVNGCLLGGVIGCIGLPILFTIIMAIIMASIGGASRNFKSESISPNSYIALIKISGVMTTGSSNMSFFDTGAISGSDSLSELIRKTADDPKAKAILLRVNSPGGTPVAAEEIGEAIKYAKTKKPVYTSMADTAASAAYWISACTSKIYANKTTLTGSIGVIMDGGDLSGLYEKLGYNPQTIKSGKFKDIGSLNRPMTSDEKALLQNMIDSTYQVFVDEVSAGRHMPREKVLELADGRVYTGNQALKANLVDKIGTYDVCLNDLAKEVNMKRPVVKEVGKTKFIDQLLATDTKSIIDYYLIGRISNLNTDNSIQLR